MKKSPIQSRETYCSPTGVCPYFEQKNTLNKCNYYKKKLKGGPMESASPRLKECKTTDPVFQDWWERSVVEKKIRGYNVLVCKEPHHKKADYKFYAKVEGLPGCFIVGDTQEEVLARAPDVINLFIDAELEHRKGPLKLVQIKFRPQQYKILAQYAKENQLSLSAAIRELALKRLKEEGYGNQT
jgi:predicted RNase H-like HicB family nuclease